MEAILKFGKKYLVDTQLVINYLNHLAHLKLNKSLRKKVKDSTVDNITDEDEDDHAMTESDDNDLIMNLVEGSDDSDSEEDDHVTFVPQLRTVTRHGRLAGTWKRNFAVFEESSDESPAKVHYRNNRKRTKREDNYKGQNDMQHTEPPNEGIFITRTGRKAGTWKRFNE